MSSVLLPYLYIILIVFIVLLVLYTIARFVPAVGEIIAHALATLFVVSWLVWSERWIEERQRNVQSSYKTFTSSLEEKARATKSSVSGVIIAHLFWFIIVAGLICGEAYNVLAAVPALFKVAYINLSDFFVIASASLFICPALAFGGIFLEVLGVTKEHLFPSLNLWRRIGLGVLSFIGLAMTLAVIYEFFQFRAFYLDATLRQTIVPLDIANLTINIFDLLAISVFLAIAFLWHAFTMGFEMIVTLLIGLFSFVLLVFRFVVSLIPRSIESVTLVLSDQTISPYDITRDPIELERRTRAKKGEKEPSDEDKVIPMPEVKLQQYASVVFGGTFGSDVFEPFRKRFQRFAPDVVLTAGFLDLGGDEEHKKFPSGVVNISPDPSARAFMRDRHGLDKEYEKLFEKMGEKQIKEHLKCRPVAAPFLYILDCSIIHYAERMLRDVHSAFDRHYLIVVTSVSERDLKNLRVQDNLRLLHDLYNDGVIACSVIIDPRSPFVKEAKHGQNIQMEFTAHAMMGLISAYKHNVPGWRNKTAMQVLAKLPEDCPYLGLSFASVDIDRSVVAAGGWWSRLMKWLSKLLKMKEKFPTGDIALITGQATGITREVTYEKNPKRASQILIDQRKHAILLCHVPVNLKSGFSEFSLEYHRRFENEFSHFSVISVSAKGTWYIAEMPATWPLQVTCFYPFDLDAILPRPTIDTKVSGSLPPPPGDTVERDQSSDASKNPSIVISPMPAEQPDINAANGSNGVPGKGAEKKTS